MGKSLYLLVLLLNLSACSTYQMRVQKSVEEMRGGNFEAASFLIKEPAFQEGLDQVAYLLDYALLQHYAGDFEESNRAFHLVEDLTDVKDYISLSDEANSLIFSESMVAYKGDDYEKILINIFKAINFMALDNDEAALVEIRRLNDKLNAYRSQAGRDYSANPLAHYLAAVLWEKQKAWDDACIEYEKFYDLKPNFPGIEEDLVFCSFVSQRWEKHRKWKKQFGINKYTHKMAKQRKEQNELLIISYQGMGPVKVPNPAWPRLPSLVPRNSLRSYTYSREITKKSLQGSTILDIDKLAIDAFNEQFGKLLAKRIAARVAKDQIRQKIKKDDQGAAFLAMVIMDVTDQADLRQWSMLPKLIELRRKNLKDKALEQDEKNQDESLSLDFAISKKLENKKLQVVLSKDSHLIYPKPAKEIEAKINQESEVKNSDQD